jgi:hypothetical protein
VLLLLQYLFEAEMDVMATTEDASEQKRRLNPKAFAGETIYQNVSLFMHNTCQFRQFCCCDCFSGNATYAIN